MTGPLMSMINHQKRLSQTSPADAMQHRVHHDAPCHQEEETDERYEVHEYKKCMEDIKVEHPHLSTGAMQQLALERCTTAQAKRRSEDGGRKKRFSMPAELLSGMMTKLQIGKNNRMESFGDDDGIPALGEDDIGDTVGSSERHGSGGSGFASSHPEAPGGVRGNKRQSLACRKSVTSLNSSGNKFLYGSLADLSESDNEGGASLQDSLDEIENSNNRCCYDRSSPMRSSSRRHSVKASHRLSAISVDLSDVEEDEDEEEGQKNGYTDTSLPSRAASSFRNGASISNQLQFEQSVSDIFPDEIKFALDGLGGNRKNGAERAAHRMKGGDSSQDSSMVESFVSVDSGNFKGDFSAWASVKTMSSGS